MNKFQSWLVDFGGADVLARRLDVTPFVVNRWRRGDGWPRISMILAIVKLAKGRLTIMDVIDCTWPKSKRGQRDH